MSCTEQPIPQGWRVWRGAVPTPITQAAMDIRDHVRTYQLGSVAKTLEYNGQTVAFWVSNHTWTYKNGVLLTGICIWGVSVLVPPSGEAVGASQVQDDISTPDPNAAVYGEDTLLIGGQPSSGSSFVLPLVIGVGVGLLASSLYAMTTQLDRGWYVVNYNAPAGTPNRRVLGYTGPYATQETAFDYMNRWITWATIAPRGPWNPQVAYLEALPRSEPAVPNKLTWLRVSRRGNGVRRGTI